MQSFTTNLKDVFKINKMSPNQEMKIDTFSFSDNNEKGKFTDLPICGC